MPDLHIAIPRTCTYREAHDIVDRALMMAAIEDCGDIDAAAERCGWKPAYFRRRMRALSIETRIAVA